MGSVANWMVEAPLVPILPGVGETLRTVTLAGSSPASVEVMADHVAASGTSPHPPVTPIAMHGVTTCTSSVFPVKVTSKRSVVAAGRHCTSAAGMFGGTSEPLIG